MTQSILFILLGWILGLFSPLIVDEIKKWRNRGEVGKAIRTELGELRLKLIFMIYLNRMQLGTFDRDLLNWMKPIVTKYQGAHVTHPILQAFDLLSSFDDAKLKGYVARESSSQSGLSMKKYSIPYLEAKMDQLAQFPEKMQSTLLSIKAHLELVNQEIDIARFYMEKTFDSSIDAANLQIIQGNLRGRYDFAAEGARTTVDLINKLDGI